MSTDTTPQAPRFGCPVCGSEEITEAHTVIADYPVKAWDEKGTPIDWAEAEAHWETAEPVEEDIQPFRCANDHEFRQPARIITDADYDDALVAASRLLERLNSLTTDEFARGAERREREELAQALKAVGYYIFDEED